MAANEAQLFELVRDTYFINPKSGDAGELPAAASALITDLARLPGQEITPVTEGNTSGSDTLRSLDEVRADLSRDFIDRARHFDHLSVAQLHPSGNMLGMLGHIASDARNNNTIIGEVSNLETAYEVESVKWLIEHVAGYHPGLASGSLVSGGSNANLTGLYVAREQQVAEFGWDGRSPVKVFASRMNHYSIDKATKLLGPNGLIDVDYVSPKHGEYVMNPAELNAKMKLASQRGERVMAIVAAAGETETGLVEDLSAIAEIADKFGTYLHIDGAYGAPYRLSRMSELFDPMKAADSLTCDPHKYLYVPYSCASILFAEDKQHGRVEELNKQGEGYMFQGDAAKAKARHATPKDYKTYLGSRRIEGSAGGHAATALYSTIHNIGRAGFAALLNHNLDMAQIFAEELKARGGQLKLSFEPTLNTVCVEPAEEKVGYKHSYDQKVEDVCAALEKNQGIYLASVSLPNADAMETDGQKRPEDMRRKVFRFVATHPHTDENDVKYIADSLISNWEDHDA